MRNVSFRFRRAYLRDLTELDRPAFVKYQNDQRYLELYDYKSGKQRPNKLFDLFLEWQCE